MFGELVGDKGYSLRQDKDWMVRLQDDMTEFCTKFEGWRKAAQKAGRWVQQVEEGAEAFMQKSHHAKSCRAAER